MGSDLELSIKTIILDVDSWGGYISIESDKLSQNCEDVLDEVKKDPGHKLRGKTLLQAIKQDKDDTMGWKKYHKKLKEEGYDIDA